MTDVTKAIMAKSDQLNADDLIGGPITITIKSVSVAETGEQKIVVNYEGDNKRPWKPSKTAARCLAAIWGVDASLWAGKRCTLYRDDTVTWAGVAVGGIRVSHAAGINEPVKILLAKARGKKEPITIYPMQCIDIEPKFMLKKDDFIGLIASACNSEELKAKWEEIKEKCKEAQNYALLGELKEEVIKKNDLLKKGAENA